MQKNTIKFEPILENLKGELSTDILYKCSFCGKYDSLPQKLRNLNESLSGKSEYYCSFCLRNKFSMKCVKNVLVFSFRGIIGYYYYSFCEQNKSVSNKMWVSDLEDYIEAHKKAGLLHPSLYYDDNTLLWFADFSRIGTKSGQVPVQSLLETVVNILWCFNLTHHFPNISTEKLYFKYEEAILKFNEQRYRPEDKRFLLPTLKDCGTGKDYQKENKEYMEWSKYFTRDDIS